MPAWVQPTFTDDRRQSQVCVRVRVRAWVRACMSDWLTHSGVTVIIARFQWVGVMSDGDNESAVKSDRLVVNSPVSVASPRMQYFIKVVGYDVLLLVSSAATSWDVIRAECSTFAVCGVISSCFVRRWCACDCECCSFVSDGKKSKVQLFYSVLENWPESCPT